MAKFSLATSETRKDKDGQKVEEVSWHKLTCWGRQAEVARDYVHKGDLLFVEGRLHYDSYENKDGQKVNTTEIHVGAFQMLGSKGGDTRPAESGSGSAPQPAPADNGGFGDDDLPF